MIRNLIHILSFCLFSAVAFAQSDFRFKNYTISDGLSQSSVTCIQQDELNALWIGTQDGLNRYDGRSFETFVSDNTEGLESAYIKCSAVDKKGNLWFGTNNGLTRYDIRKERFQTFSPKKNQAFQIEDIKIDDSGIIWIASSESGIYSFEPVKSKFTDLSKLVPSRRTTAIHLLDKNSLICSTDDKGLFIIDLASHSSEVVKSPTRGPRISVNSISEVKKGTILVNTDNGVFEYDMKRKGLQTKFGDLNRRFGLQNVEDVHFHESIGWFIATNGNGLFTIYNDGFIQHNTEDIFQKNALLFNELNVLFKDNAGTIWVGSQRGLSSFNPLNKGFLGVGPSGNHQKGIPSASVWSFTESESGRFIYVGTDRAISRLDKESGQFTQYYRGQKERAFNKGETAVLSLYAINENHLLVGCADGLFELLIGVDGYEFKEITIRTNTGEIKHDRIYAIKNWKGSKCLIATKDGAVIFDYKTRKSESFEHDPAKPTATISKGICRVAFKDRNGRMWLATSTGGLNLLSERDGKIIIRPYEYNSVIRATSKDYITSIYHDQDGIYWFGSFGSGLIKWNEKTKIAKVYNKSDGLPNDVIYGVVSDSKGMLWLSTNKGLCMFDPLKERAKNYTEIDGLMSNEFNLGAYMLSSSGQLYFGGIYGYNYFNPKHLTERRKNIGVVFSGFKLENEWLRANSDGSPLVKPIFETKEIKLSYKQRSFTLRFQPSNLSNPERINYKYRLEGSEEGDISIGAMNEIHFNSLSSGRYTLKVYARIGDGMWSTSPAVMKILIAKPFWSTWWFLIILAIILAVLIRMFVRSRMDAARREQMRLEIKVRDRTKEIQKQSEKIEAQRKAIEEERNKVLEQQRLLEIEKDKTEKLLRNVIPESTAEELKKSGKARARAYKTVSVLFTDFVGFTNISEKMNPTELVKKLDVYFTKFDEIIVKNNLEKIKTIGDAYMCAGGVPVRNKTNPIDTCLAAIQIQDYMRQRKEEALQGDGDYWDLRLGINTGEVTAGVIGSERLAYDIWGATVNQAQRMEMLGQPGQVTITGSTHIHIEPYFDTTFKGKAQTKSRGLIDMYVVERIKPELSKKGEGIYPNNRFHEIVNLHLYSSINYYKAERHIIKVLEQHLTNDLHYHSIWHTMDVVNSVERIALLEGVTDEGLFLLKSAATYHDAGFIEQYDKNEPIGARLAEEILPKYGYTEEHIEQIKKLIYVTTIPHQPQNKLEEIMCDADLDYLGRDDFHEIADKLRLELREHGKIDSDRKWDEIQVAFLSSHKYFTKTAKRMRLKKKEQNLKEIIARLERNQYKD